MPQPSAPLVTDSSKKSELMNVIRQRLENLCRTHAFTIGESTGWDLYNDGSGLLVIDKRAIDLRLNPIKDSLQEVIAKRRPIQSGIGMQGLIQQIANHWNGTDWHPSLFSLKKTAEKGNEKLALVRLQRDGD